MVYVGYIVGLVMPFLPHSAAGETGHAQSQSPGGQLELRCGAVTAGGGGSTLSISLGQPTQGVLASAGFSVRAGFAHCLLHHAAIPGDVDGNQIIDLADHSAFTDCMTGPGGGHDTAECPSADVDADGDVDLRDWRELAIRIASEQ